MRRRKPIVAAAAAVVLVAVGGVAYAQTGSSGSYRTATVTSGDVDQVMALSGTITASARRDLSFGAAGTVAKVKVTAGDRVRSGATLATLDPTDLDAAVTKAEATLAKAKAQLESDQTSQASTVTSATSTSSASGSAQKAPSTKTSSSKTPSTKTDTDSDPKRGTSGASPALTKALAQLKTQQTAVTGAQTAATEAITSAKTALAAQVAACSVDEDGAETPADADESPDEVPEPAALAPECTTALDDVQAAQDVVADKQDALQSALQKLSTTLGSAVKALAASSDSDTPASPVESASPATPAPAATPAASDATSSSAPATDSGSRGVTVTAAGLAKDQAAIDTASAQLAEAEQARTAAELTAPFSGEILSVSAAKGDAVGASDVVIVISGDGSTTVSTTATLEQIPDIDKGQVARVTPAGASESVSGEVTAIGLLPVSSSDSSTYPVTIVLDDDVAAPEGSTASIALVTGTAKDVVTVPSSAVTAAGRSTVSVLADGEVVRAPVTVGVVGTTRTEITDGLEVGQVVVLADLGVALPSGDGSTTRLPGARGGFSGGAPGGARPAGGAPQ